MILKTRLSEITIDDLQSLIDNQVAEEKRIEYKSDLPDRNDKGKKEFLKDISSFANTAGGHIVYGMSEKKGLPIDLVGLHDIDSDNEILRFENTLRDAVRPRIPGATFKAILIDENKTVIIGFIPKSWVSPHMITFNKSSKFYARNSAGAYRLDVDQLRMAFTASSVESEKIRNFHAKRIGNILSDETPIQINAGPKIAMHVIPVGVMESGVFHDLKRFELSDDRWFLQPLDGFCNYSRFNIDGVMTYQGDSNTGTASSYVQLFRNGVIETVATSLSRPGPDRPIIYSAVLEKKIVEAIGQYFKIFDLLGLNTPIFILISLMGVKGYELPSERKNWHRDRHYRIDRNELFVPEILVEDKNMPIHKILKPAFDAIWNAAGEPESPYYDAEGNWMNEKR